MSDQSATKKSEKTEQEVALKCPKGMKLPKAAKVQAMMGRTREERNFIMRSVGIALHEQAYKAKANPERTSQNRTVKSVPDSPAE